MRTLRELKAVGLVDTVTRADRDAGVSGGGRRRARKTITIRLKPHPAP